MIRFVGQWFTGLLLGCTLVACQGLPKQKGLLEKEIANSHISSHQLRVMVNEFVIHAAHRIELRADEILANSADPLVRRHALQWKINTISASFRAASRSDSLAAYIDLWILNRQLYHLFESPLGEKLFGTWQSIPREETLALDKRLQQIQHTIGGNLSIGEEFVNKFATDYPLTNLYLDREPFASRYIEEVKERSQELFQVVASLDENLSDLKKLSILYSEHLPKQARWEAELFLMDATGMSVVQQPLHDFSLATDAISRIARTTEAIPELVATERQALTQLVTHEREQTLRDLDRMREATLSKLADERSIMIDAMRSERSAAVDALRQERIAVTHTLNTELSRAFQATDSITQQRTTQLMQQAPKVIDHLVWRVVQLATTLILVGLIARWILVKPQRSHFHERIAATLFPQKHQSTADPSTPAQAMNQILRSSRESSQAPNRAA